MSYQPAINPWDIINNPPVSTLEVWGKVDLIPTQVVLIKGQGKVLYSPGQVMPDGSEPKPLISLKVVVTAIPEMHSTYPENMREIIATSWGEWGEIVLPSIRDCGVMQVENLNGKYARVELVPTGRQYTNRNGDKRDATTFKFLQVFPTEQECRAAYLASKGGASPRAASTPTQPAPTSSPAPTPNGSNQATALKFLNVFVKQAVSAGSGDLERTRQDLAQKIALQPLLAQYFTVDSPEVIELLMQEMSK